MQLCLATGMGNTQCLLIAAEQTTSTGNSNTDSETDDVEVIEVKGIQRQFNKVQRISKRDMNQGVVDIISAEDMGKFPDTNLAESLQRITGVTVSRSQMVKAVK